MKWIVIFSVTVLIVSWLLIRRGTNNVCRTFEDYYSNRDNNKNCYYNPDAYLTVPDIIKRHGYPIETHEVITEDGYILTLFRIPHRKNFKHKTPGKPVLITHGASINSAVFVNRGEKSLGFILADAGYDVWLANLRGTIYSRKHVQLNETDSKYWEFSFHEQGIYDLPAQIDFITQITKQKIIYIGYSMGTTAAYIYGTTYPNIAKEKIQIFISLAPAVFLQNENFKFLISIWPTIKDPLQFLTAGKIFPLQLLPEKIHELLCYPFPFQMKMCHIWEMFTFGNDYDQLDPETLPITLTLNSDAVSIRTVTHFRQMVTSRIFQSFDYGIEKSKGPILYNISKLTVPTYLIVAKNDLSVTEKDVEELYKILPNKTKSHGIHVIDYEKFNHVDFVKAKDVVSLLYNHLVTFINSL